MDLLCNLITSPKSKTVSVLAIYALEDIMDREAGAGDDRFYKKMVTNAGLFRELSKLIRTHAIEDADLDKIFRNFVLRYAPQ